MDERLLAQYPNLERTHFWWMVRRRWVRDALMDCAAHGRLLDIGCGSGVTMESVADICSEVLGVELQAEAVPDDAPLRDQILIGDFADQDFVTGGFDQVLLMDVIEHIENPTAFIEKVADVAAADAIVLVSVPAFSWLWTSHDTVNAHYRRYTRKTLRDELEQGGLEVDRVAYLFMGLVAPKLMQRIRERIGPQNDEHVDLELPGWTNRLAAFWFLGEYRVCRWLRLRLPFGTSVVAVARPRRPN